METLHNEDMEETYNRRLEKDFVEQLKGRVKRVSKKELSSPAHHEPCRT